MGNWVYEEWGMGKWGYMWTWIWGGGKEWGMGLYVDLDMGGGKEWDTWEEWAIGERARMQF